MDVANTSYIVSYRKKFSQEVYDKIYKNIINQKFMVENTSKELIKFKVWSYVTRVSIPTFFKGVEAKGYLRMYFYEQTNSIMLSPLIISGDISEDNFLTSCKEIVKKLCNSDTMKKTIEMLNSEEVKCYSVKARLVNLLLSHIILVRFLKQYFETDLNIPTCIDDRRRTLINVQMKMKLRIQMNKSAVFGHNSNCFANTEDRATLGSDLSAV